MVAFSTEIFGHRSVVNVQFVHSGQQSVAVVTHLEVESLF